MAWSFRAVADDFEAALKQKFSMIVPTGLKGLASFSADSINQIVENVIEENYQKFKSNVFDSYTGHDQLKSYAFIAKSRLASILGPLYSNIISAYTVASKEAFDLAARRVSPNSKLVDNLRLQAQTILRNFQSKQDELRKGKTPSLVLAAFRNPFISYACLSCLLSGKLCFLIFAVMLNILHGKSAVGLFAPALLRGAEARIAPLESKFPTEYSVKSLRSYLSDACKDREKLLFLQGTYNPYIRDKPYPPTHININYLIDPRAISAAAEYEKLYDEQIDGPTVNRANPLLIPGVARVPFDPNEHPVPKDQRSWWNMLVDFYSDSDEEGDEEKEA